MSIFNQFSTHNLRGDILGGVTAAIVSLPIALAFGIASGAGAEAGLYGAILVGLFSACFGGTPTLISEPTGPMTVVMTAVITTMMAQNPENGLAMAFTVVMIAGLFQILLGTLKLGKYITLMPYSVISGFMSGIGVILIILQLAPFLGQPEASGSIVERVAYLPALFSNIQMADAALGVGALLFLLFSPKKLSRYLPPQLLVLIVGASIPLLFMANIPLQRIGEFHFGLPHLHLPHFTEAQMMEMLLDGMILGTLGCIDSLLTAVISDSLTRQEHKSNKELIGQGVGNIMSGLFGGLPGAGATMGTVVNIQSGARSAISGITRVGALLIFVVAAADFTQNIPLAVLAAIAIKVGIDILDWSFLRRAHRVSPQAAFIMYGVMLLTIFVDLIVAVGIGIFIANILTIERLSRYQSNNNIKAISDADDEVQLSQEEKSLLEAGEGKVLLLYFSGPLIFGMAKAIAREQATIHNYAHVVIDLTHVPLIDATALLAIENGIRYAQNAQCEVRIVCRHGTTKTNLRRLDACAQIPETHFFEDRADALRHTLSHPPLTLAEHMPDTAPA